MRIQIIGNYLENVSSLLSKKGIITENIIKALNPIAMAGNCNLKFLHYSNEIDSSAVVLNSKKNLAQMLSHDEKNFCSNEKKPAVGTEVRYRNSTDYIIVCNSYIAVKLFEDNDAVYSEIWPQNKMSEELNADKSLRIIRFPFPGGFNWKYYYDNFINAIKAEYDADHIILIKINSSQWYTENDSIFRFEPMSKAFKNAVEEIDDYFEQKTNCHVVDALFSQMPEQKHINAFPYEVFADYSHKRIADEIYNIITGKRSNKSLYKYRNPSVRYIAKRFSHENKHEIDNLLDLMENEGITSLDECKKDIIGNEIVKLAFFLDSKTNNGLSDFINPLEIISENQISEKLDIIALYIKYLKVDLNDFIAIYKFYCSSQNKIGFKNIVSELLNKKDFGPIKSCFDLVEKNINYLKNYKYISEELLEVKRKNTAYIQINENSYIYLDPDSENPMRQIKIETCKINHIKIADNGYICDIKEAVDLCLSWKMYIEKAWRGDGDKPFKIIFNSDDDFEKSLFYVDYTDLLETESFVLSTNCECEIDGACAKTNLDFLFKPNVKICVVAGGLADQIAYYVFSEVLREKTNSDIYFYTRALGDNGKQFDKFAKRDVSEKLVSNYISEKLLEQTYGNSWNFAHALYDNGILNIAVVLGGWAVDSADKVKCSKIVIDNIPLFFTTNLNSLSYYWCLVRPDQIMEHFPFKLSDYICFPDFESNDNLEISAKMLQSDSISIHVRRGDFVTVGRADDLGFYRDSIKKVLNISQYKNKKWFIFSDDIPFCKSHSSELGLDLICDEEITFIDHNKQENSYRDMQLMTYSKVIIGGNSGFSRIAAIYSDRCEVFIYRVKWVMDLFKRIGKGSKYDVDALADTGKNKNSESQNKPSAASVSENHSEIKTKPIGDPIKFDF